MDITGKRKIEIFCCYASEDQELLLAFRKHLRPLEQQGFITIWSDIDINAGVEWENEIERHLNFAQIILLFVSPDFMQSDYCYSTQMKRAMERHEHEEAHVIPIILRPVSWKKTPFGKLQVLPANTEPVISRTWHTPDDAFLNVTEGIEKRIEELVASQPSNITNEQRLKASTVLDSAISGWPLKIEKSNGDRFNKFTKRVRSVLSLAQEEAIHLHVNYIDTEHLLLEAVSKGLRGWLAPIGGSLNESYKHRSNFHYFEEGIHNPCTNDDKR